MIQRSRIGSQYYKKEIIIYDHSIYYYNVLFRISGILEDWLTPLLKCLKQIHSQPSNNKLTCCDSHTTVTGQAPRVQDVWKTYIYIYIGDVGCA